MTNAQAAVVQPSALLSEEYVFNSAVDTINNDRMINPVNGGDSLATALTAVHEFGGVYDGSFVTTDPGSFPSDFFDSLPDGDTDVDLVFDITGGGDTSLGSVILWNYENSGGSNISAGNHARTIELRFNSEADGSESFDGPATTVTLLPVWDGDEDDTNDLQGVNSAQAFSLGTPVTARYAMLSITDNYLGFQGITGGGDRVGLAEVRFASETVVPEPSTLSLLALAAATMVAGVARSSRTAA
ncbi:PEP-CTERM sorting domain-containing protein [Aeoliella mucimassa]|nr:PEP-CTERM sorting domain-containing protein [Aeoliella mucimassa]